MSFSNDNTSGSIDVKYWSRRWYRQRIRKKNKREDENKIGSEA